MIFVVKAGVNRNSLEKRDIRDRIYKELNQEGKHQVVMLPGDCTYDVIHDEPVKDVKIVDKESARGII